MSPHTFPTRFFHCSNVVLFLTTAVIADPPPDEPPLPDCAQTQQIVRKGYLPLSTWDLVQLTTPHYRFSNSLLSTSGSYNGSAAVNPEKCSAGKYTIDRTAVAKIYNDTDLSFVGISLPDASYYHAAAEQKDGSRSARVTMRLFNRTVVFKSTSNYASHDTRYNPVVQHCIYDTPISVHGVIEQLTLRLDADHEGLITASAATHAYVSSNVQSVVSFWCSESWEHDGDDFHCYGKGTLFDATASGAFSAALPSSREATQDDVSGSLYVDLAQREILFQVDGKLVHYNRWDAHSGIVVVP